MQHAPSASPSIGFRRILRTAYYYLVTTLCLTTLPSCRKSEDPQQPSHQPAAVRIESSRRPQSDKNKEQELTASKTPDTTAPSHKDSVPTGPVTLITGRVTLPDGKAAEATTVTLLSAKAITHWTDPIQHDRLNATVTDQSGHYKVGVATRKDYVITAQCNGYPTFSDTIANWGSFYYKMAHSEIGKDIRLQAPVQIAGVVLNPQGDPTSASITAFHSTRQGLSASYAERVTTTTRSEGKFLLDCLPAGDLVLEARSEEYAPLVHRISAPNDKVELRFLGSSIQVSGHVLLYPANSPITAATVTLIPDVEKSKDGSSLILDRQFAFTDETGAFAIKDIPAGDYKLGAMKDALKPIPKPADSYRISINETTSGQQILLYPGHTITGHVRDKVTSQPIEGVRLIAGYSWLLGDAIPDVEAISGSSGMFELKKVFAYHGNSIPLSASHPFYVVERPKRQSEPLTALLSLNNLTVVCDIAMVHTVTISGNVQQVGGIPVAGATLSIFAFRQQDNPPLESARSDGSGFYEIQARPHSTCNIAVEAPGFPKTYSSPIMIRDASTSGVDIILKPGAAIMGTVESPGGEAVAGATVVATFVIQTQYSQTLLYPTAVTDSNGGFEFKNVLEGNVTLLATQKGFAPSEKFEITLKPGDVKRGVKLQLLKGHYLAGKVIDERGDAVPQAQVSIGTSDDLYSVGYQARSADHNGQFRIEDIPHGSYNVRAMATNYTAAKLSSIIPDRDDLVLTLKKDEPDKATLKGFVIDAVTRDPIKDFSVSGFSDGVFEKSQTETGVFRIKDMTGTYFTLTISAPGYKEGQQHRVSVPTAKGEFEQRFEIGRGSMLSGRVIDQISRKPIPGIKVDIKSDLAVGQGRIAAPDHTVTTDAEGRFQFTELLGRVLVYIAPQPPHTEWMLWVQMRNEEDTAIQDIELREPITLRGRVVQGTGDIPVAETSIEIHSAATQHPPVKTGFDGRFVFENLPPGEYDLKVPEHSLVVRAHAISANDDPELVIRVGGTKLEGQIVRVGKPAAADVSLSLVNGSLQKSASVGTSGQFVMEALAAGKWTAQVTLRAESVRHTEEIEIREGETLRHTFVVNSGRIVGEVVDSNGKTLPRAGVRIASKLDGRTYTTSLMTGSDGRFERNMEPGSYAVMATGGGGGASEEVMVTVPPDGDSQMVKLRIVTEGGALISKTYSLKTGEPLISAHCTIKTMRELTVGQDARRDSNGVMRIESLPAGRYKVEVGASGYSIARHVVEIRPSETVELNDVLYPAGIFRWTLLANDGSRLSNVNCTITPDDPSSIEGPHSGITGGNGVWQVMGLQPGPYTAIANTLTSSALTARTVINPAFTSEIVTRAP